MLRGLVCGAWLTAAALSPALAQQPAPAPPPQVPAKPPPFVYFNELGDTVVSKCDAVVLGKVASVKDFPGGSIVRVTVSSWLLGEHGATENEVTLLAHPDDFFAGNELLLFLQKFEGGPRFTYVNRILKSDPDFEAKRKVLDQTLELRSLKQEEDRRRQVFRLIYEGAQSRDSWTRWHSLADLKHVLSNHKGLVTDDDRTDLRSLAQRSTDAKFQKALLAALSEKEKTP